MNKLKKGLTWLPVILIGPVAGLMAFLFAYYPIEYTLRVLRWGNADVYDYRKFPERRLAPGATPFHFRPNHREESVRTLFAGLLGVEPSAGKEKGQPELDAFLERTGTQAFLVIQNDSILFERYFNGAERESIVTSFSMAKSFTSALIGIAIAEGAIQDVNDPITDYLPELIERDPAFARITIRHLLLMSSGIRYEEFPFVNGDDAKTYYYPDLRSLALYETEIAGPPGRAFLYNNFHPLLLGLILERATGVRVAEYLERKIWKPMGAARAGSWSLDERGFEKMESGINGRALDFAKFGRLFLKQGERAGRPIIPAAWVRASTLPDEPSFDCDYPEWFRKAFPGGYYKYMWWGFVREGHPADFAALGNHGQIIYVSPHKELIIVRHGERYGVESPRWLRLFFDFATRIEIPEKKERA